MTYPNRVNALYCPSNPLGPLSGHATIDPFTPAVNAYMRGEACVCVHCGVGLNLGFYAHHVDSEAERLISERNADGRHPIG